MSYKTNKQLLREATSTFFKKQYDASIEAQSVNIKTIPDDIEGDYSIVLFPYLKRFGVTPQELGDQLAEYIQSQDIQCGKIEVVKGFLNLTFANDFWTRQLTKITDIGEDYAKGDSKDKKVVIEFCSPNTNKPLHLGHIRNILIGWSMSEIIAYTGNDVKKVQIINDRGIAICKSILAWQQEGNGETPESSGVKGDHLVGKYYVMFEKLFKKEYADWQDSNAGETAYIENQKENEKKEHFFPRYKNTYFNTHSAIGKKAKELLLAWESGDSEVVGLWKKMNGWVYEGFDETYDALGVSFDKLYYESDTYLLGKDVIAKGLTDKIFYQKEDNSTWVDLEDKGLDQKLVLRSDGTSVYITQDIGTAIERHKDFGFDQMIYVVGNEQDYHFQALFATMDKLGMSYAQDMHHLSYGMVDLPSGKMKSREGTVVDADDLVKEVIGVAEDSAKDSQFLADLSAEDKSEVYRNIGLGALKYFILKVNAKKRMTFDPSQSVDMHGVTAPYIQNAYVRIQAILSKSEDVTSLPTNYQWQPQEKKLISLLDHFNVVINHAAQQLDPSLVAHHVYDFAKEYHRFYNDHKILGAESSEAVNARLMLSRQVGLAIKVGMRLLGISMPQRM